MAENSLNPRAQMEGVFNRRQVDSEEATRRLEESSRKRLEQIILSKLRTTFIGALSEFEAVFGYLWGHGRPPEECSGTELSARELWEVCRTAILDKGNTHIRAIQKELPQYIVRWHAYVTQAR